MLRLIRGGTLIDCTGGAPVENAAVLLDGEKIVKVGTVGDVQVTTNEVETFDATGMTIMPGIIDSR